MPVPSRPIPDLARGISADQINQCFGDAHFPADRQQVVNYARDHFAAADLLAVLDSMPEQIYHNPSQITQAIQDLTK